MRVGVEKVTKFRRDGKENVAIFKVPIGGKTLNTAPYIPTVYIRF